MLQLYALAVVVDIIIGTIVIFDRKNGEGYCEVSSFLHNNTFVLTTTIFAGIVAISILITPYTQLVDGKLPFSAIPIFGDLVPAFATLLGHLVFLSRYIKGNYPTFYTSTAFFSLIEQNEFYIAIFCIVSAVLHFFFPAVLFL